MPHSRGWERRADERRDDPVPLADVIDGLVGEHPFPRGMDLGRIAAVWGSVVGERLARETAPVDLEAGVLTVAASNSIWGAQVRFLVEEIRRSANETLGSEAIREVRIAIR